jgi:hypothetical protein
MKMTPTGYWITNIGTALLGLIPATLFAEIVAMAWPVMKIPAFALLFSWWVGSVASVVARDNGARTVRWTTWRKAFRRQTEKAESTPRTIEYVLGISTALLIGFVCAVLLGVIVGSAWPNFQLPAFALALAWWLSVGSYIVFRDKRRSEGEQRERF